MGELLGDDAVLASQTFTAEGRLHATYNFNLLEWGGLDVAGLRQAITDAVEAFNNSGRLVFAFSNHDVRSVTRQLGALGLSSEHQDALQLLLKLEVSLVGSNCIYQGEELALEDVQNIPVEKMRDPWGIEFAPNFAGRDSCRTHGLAVGHPAWRIFRCRGYGAPQGEGHFARAALEQAATAESVYQQFSAFLHWRKSQPAMMRKLYDSPVRHRQADYF